MLNCGKASIFLIKTMAFRFLRILKLKFLRKKKLGFGADMQRIVI